ncbi:uncharacterized protein LOC114352955, partial [Ostrinia furnacalis]|uniref:uncharacterized protein LOC114352955 n=1 Tax=Ostrinia furnacalis TaxID=93504 RepID=UPI00103FF040
DAPRAVPVADGARHAADDAAVGHVLQPADGVLRVPRDLRHVAAGAQRRARAALDAKLPPTWTFFGPLSAMQLAKAATTPDHFISLETVLTLGSQLTPEIMAALKKKRNRTATSDLSFRTLQNREARARVSAAQLLLHCMRQAPDFVCMINGATGEQTTNREMLELAIPFARKLRAQGLKGKTVMLVARDHERTVAVYLVLLLAGVLAYLTDPGATKYELQHYLRLVEPALVFCDEATQAAVRVATADAPAPAHVLPIHDDALLDYIQGHTDDLDSFEAEDSEEGAASLLLPTSGSTGLPKAAQYNHHGLVSQLATPCTTAAGWLRTGDAFRQDRARRLHYCRRIKFCFKYENRLLSPEELEKVIGQLPGVAECVVSDSARGPAAAVVLRAGASEPDARRAIHRVVETTLSDHKRLRGGVAFVAAIPRTHTGKAHRQQAKDLIQRLIEEGICYY